MAASLQGSAKLAAVTTLINKLRDDLTEHNLTTPERDSALEDLKVYGRDPRNADPIFTKEGIKTLLQHAFSDNSPKSTAQNALRVICNTLFLNAETRQMFIDLGYEGKACERLKNDDRDDEFLVSRVLFLTTYGTTVDLGALIDNHQLADSIVKNIARHAELRSSGIAVTDPMTEMAMTESLKLLFNITHFATKHTDAFTPAVPHIVALLCNAHFQTPKPLDPPVSFLVNALLNLDLSGEETQAALYPAGKPQQLADRLIDLLAQASKVYRDAEYDVNVTPLIGVIRAVHEYAPQDVKLSAIRPRLLPAEADRAEVLGHSDSLPSWLLKNTTNALAPKLREVVSDLLFDLSDKDPSTFVANVGYGFASGYLFNKNLPVPAELIDGESTDKEEGVAATRAAAAAGSSRPVNPITGQFLDREKQPDGPEMTDEEKEREAERLFVLFERLRANGIISAENPLRTAVEEGRFEELPDDYDEDEDKK